MTRRVAFAYARARLQAHHGRRPGPETWQHLERIGDFGHYVQSAGGSPLRPWIVHVGPQSESHQIEQALRERFREHVDAVARWQPRPWGPAVRWAARIADLPLLQHLLQDRPAPGWMTRDPLFRALAEERAEDRRAALRASPAFGGLVRDWESGRTLAGAWAARWRALWPDASAGERRALRSVEARLRADYEHLQGAFEAEGVETEHLAPALEADLTRLFRRHTQEPAAAFIHLALVWLDVARLRGGLVRRRLLPRAA